MQRNSHKTPLIFSAITLFWDRVAAVNHLVLIFLLFCLTLHTYAQVNDANRGAVVDYKIYNNTSIPNTLTATLYISENFTIYIPKYTTQKINDEKQAARHPTTTIPDWRYVKIDHLSKRIVFFDEFGRNRFLVDDQYPQHNWIITTEARTISGYNCIKATTNYRGRVWEAWFTPDIPLPYGPWKLFGLPGLIIEAKEDTGTYTLRAEKIEYRKDPVFDKEFASLVQTRNTEPISIKKFIQDSDEFYINGHNERVKRWPDSHHDFPNLRHGYELKYEWE